MAIDAYVGLPGHGKSYSVVRHVIVPNILQGRRVVTNIPLNIDAIEKGNPGVVVDIHQLPDDWHQLETLDEYATPGTVLIVDECWRRWPSGLKANNIKESDKSLFAEHRHRVDDDGNSMQIVLVTQDLSQIASFFRQLVETTYRQVKLTKSRYRVDVYSGSVTGGKPPKYALLSQMFESFDKRFYAYYSSATMSKTGAVGNESKSDKRGGLLFAMRWPLIFIALAIFVIPFVLLTFKDTLGGMLNTSPPDTSQELQRAPQAPRTASQALRVDNYPALPVEALQAPPAPVTPQPEQGRDLWQLFGSVGTGVFQKFLIRNNRTEQILTVSAFSCSSNDWRTATCDHPDGYPISIFTGQDAFNTYIQSERIPGPAKMLQ